MPSITNAYKSFSLLLILVAGTTVRSQRINAAPGLTPDQLRTQETILAAGFERAIETRGFHATRPAPDIVVDPSSFSRYVFAQNKVVNSQWETASPQMKQKFDGFAAVAADGTTGEQLSNNSFHKFFFIHELCHRAMWQSSNSGIRSASVADFELEANRFIVAYWRAKDPVFLNRLLREYRAIAATLQKPVPSKRPFYRGPSYESLVEPTDFGWGELFSVLQTADEKPAPVFGPLVKELSGAPQ